MRSRYALPAITEPAGWVAQFKSFARVDFADHDALITRHLKSAREWFERETWILTVERAVILHLDTFPVGVIEIERTPISSITSIDYNDTNGTPAVWDVSEWVFDLGDDRHPARIQPAIGNHYPAVHDALDDVQVTMTAGYNDITTLPERYLDAIFSYARDLYERDGALTMGTEELIEHAKWRHV